MQIAIKPGVNFKSKIKYIIVNKKNHRFTLIPGIEGDKLENIYSLINNKFPETDICHLEFPSLKQEILFIWPQIIKDFRERFFQTGGWLTRARLHIKNDTLQIELESKMAYKTINTGQIINFLQDRFSYYLEKKLEIIIILNE